MKIVDTHCHLHFDAFDQDREAVIGRARQVGVEHFVNVGADPEMNEKAALLAQQHYFMKHTVGMHPHSAHLADKATLEKLERQIADTKPAAIGEIGLDYFKSEAEPGTQKRVFRHMIALAKEFKLPLIVHSRNAFDDTYEILKEEQKGLTGVMHCFSYDEESMRKLLEIGFLVSFTCNLTFKGASALLEVAKKALHDSFMLETDSPYLAPQSHRGQRNEPAFLMSLIPFLAEARGDTPESVAMHTTQNARNFFKFS